LEKDLQSSMYSSPHLRWCNQCFLFFRGRGKDFTG